MSNKIVPTIYRSVIDDVVSSIKHEFDEYGVAEDVLAELQHKWENKVIASHVAEFEAPHHPPAPQHHFPPHPMHMIHPHYASPYPPPPPPQNGAQPHVKAEPVDNRYILNGPQGVQYTLPPLPGPQMTTTARPQPPPPHVGGQTSVLSFPSGPVARPPPGRTYLSPTSASASGPPTQSGQRIPQVDGPSDSDSDSPSPSSYAPRPSHPSLPQPQAQSQSSTNTDDAEAINSDLDDSDTEGDEEAEETTDIVFCTYDKVARVKNKWKCVLKDGMIHVDGKDYLFAKCTGEFEF